MTRQATSMLEELEARVERIAAVFGLCPPPPPSPGGSVPVAPLDLLSQLDQLRMRLRNVLELMGRIEGLL